ncbi:MAG: YdeI/OmpD-associated family protein [Bauldia sp.]
MKFSATIKQSGKTATGIEVPPVIVAGLGSSRKPAVTVTIRGYSYPSTIATMGGVFMIPISAEVRAGAGVAAGERIEVEVVLDDKPRELAVPDDLGTAIGADPAAKAFWEGLSYSNRRRFVLQVDGAKTAETRQRRIAGTIEKLRKGEV